MADALNVDTSLTDAQSGSTGLGVDSLIKNPDLSSYHMPLASADEFAALKQSAGLGNSGFTQGHNAVAGPSGLDLPSDAVLPDADGSLRGDIVSAARKFLGTPYVWGGSGPSGFDCSGFTQYVLKGFGVNLPRISFQQANFGPHVGLNQLRVGDLVAWDENSRNKGADHIAIYIGNGMIIEAPHTGANVRIRKLGRNEKAWGVAITYPGEKKNPKTNWQYS